MLGAAVAQLVAGRELGARAAVVGAVCGTLPDLDVLVRHADPVTAMVVHRSWSHSWFWLTLASLPLWLLARLLPGLRAGGVRLLAAIWLALVTHPLLDCLTIYGTQALQPFSDYPISIGSVFIIDPAFSLPLAAGLWLALRRPARARRLLSATLAYCCGFLVVSLLLQARLEAALRADSSDGAERILATPTPFNLVRWRLLRLTPSGHCDQFVYAWRSPEATAWRCYEQQRELGAALARHAPYTRLRWFTHGWYALRVRDDEVVVSDLRMGVEGFYIFRFVVGVVDGTGVRPVPARQLAAPAVDLDALPRAYAHVE